MAVTNDSLNVNNQTVTQEEPGNTGLSNAMESMTVKTPEVKPGNGEKTEGNETVTESKVYPTWTSQLPESLRSDEKIMAQLSKFEKIGDLANSYSELEKKLGKSVVTPGKDASEEEINSFYQKLGMPTSADGYSIEGENTDDYKKIAFDAKLTKSQAETLFKSLTEYGQKQYELQKESRERQLRETDEMLHKEYGNRYSEKINLLKRGVEMYGGKELGELLQNAGIFYNPQIVKLFIQLGEESAESGMSNKGIGGKSDRYTPTSEGGSFTFKGL